MKFDRVKGLLSVIRVDYRHLVLSESNSIHQFFFLSFYLSMKSKTEQEANVWNIEDLSIKKQIQSHLRAREEFITIDFFSCLRCFFLTFFFESEISAVWCLISWLSSRYVAFGNRDHPYTTYAKKKIRFFEVYTRNEQKNYRAIYCFFR